MGRGTRAKSYVVRVNKDEREQGWGLLKKGKMSARKLCRAQILPQADGGASATAIATAGPVDGRPVERSRKRWVEEGREAAVNERRRPGGNPTLDGSQEAFLIALAWSATPPGRLRWTMQLLADRVVEIGLVPSRSDDTVRRTLKKTPSNRD